MASVSLAEGSAGGSFCAALCSGALAPGWVYVEDDVRMS